MYWIRVYNRSSINFDDKRKGIFVLAEGATQGLDNTVIIAETKYAISFKNSEKKNLSSLHCNSSNSFLFVNTVNMYHFKGKYSNHIHCV